MMSSVTCHIRIGQYLAQSHVEFSFQSLTVLNWTAHGTRWINHIMLAWTFNQGINAH